MPPGWAAEQFTEALRCDTHKVAVKSSGGIGIAEKPGSAKKYRFTPCDTMRVFYGVVMGTVKAPADAPLVLQLATATEVARAARAATTVVARAARAA